MKYLTLKKLIHDYYRNHNNADGSGVDNTVDANITRDPNNYLAPVAGRLDWLTILVVLSSVATIVCCFIQLKNTKL